MTPDKTVEPKKGGGSKPKGPHKTNRLTDTRIRAIKKPGRYGDGNCLFLIVEPSTDDTKPIGSKHWVLYTTVKGKRVNIALGGYAYTPLAKARQKAREYREIAKSGGDPRAEKRKAERGTPTFKEAAEIVHGSRKNSWRNPKHRDQWLSTLQNHAFPIIGDMRVDQIDRPDILKVLEPIWHEKPEVARRVKQRMSAVFEWANAAGHRDAANPITTIKRALGKQTDTPKNFAAMEYKDVPDFVAMLRAGASGEITRLALEFLIQVACRSSEARKATWNEVDFDNATWTIPADRTKTEEELVVPLTPRCIQILKRAHKLAGNEPLVFPGTRQDRPLSENTFAKVLHSAGLNYTAHGFRSSFRTWASDETFFPREICEKALGHKIGNKVEQAYNRSALLERRRQLMTLWSHFVAQNDEWRSFVKAREEALRKAMGQPGLPDGGATVIPLRA